MWLILFTLRNKQNLDDSSRLTMKQGESMETAATVQPSNIMYSHWKLASLQWYLTIIFISWCISGTWRGKNLIIIFILNFWTQEIQFAVYHSLTLKELLWSVLGKTEKSYYYSCWLHWLAERILGVASETCICSWKLTKLLF